MLFVACQLADVVEKERRRASRRRQFEPLAGTPRHDRLSQVEPQPLQDDPYRARRPHQVQVRARHLQDLQILVGFACSAPVFPDLQHRVDVAGRHRACDGV